MRIPPSVVVMSLVTAVPFGLAIRDTVRHHDAVPDLDVRQDLTVDQAAADRLDLANEELETAKAEAEAARAEAEVAVARTRAGIVGSTPASLGSMFQGIEIGEPASRFSPDDARRATDPSGNPARLRVNFDVDAVRVKAIEVSLLGGCDDFADTLRHAWGETADDAPDIWLTADGAQRATFDTDGCELVFERDVSTLAWVDALPLTAIGGPENKLATAIGPDADRNDRHILWTTPGVGRGHGATELQAYLLDGKVAAIRIAFQTDRESATAIRDRLAIRFHAKPTLDTDMATYVWARKVPVAFQELNADKFELLIGTIP